MGCIAPLIPSLPTGPVLKDVEREIAVPRICDRTLGIPILMLLLSLVPADSTMAQMGTPAGYPSAPDPGQCVIEPASIEEIAAILGTLVAEPIESATPFVRPAGPPADAEATADVVATLHQLFACANAGDPLRVASHFTEDFVRDFFGGAPRQDLLDFLAAPPQALPNDQQRIIVRIEEVQLLPDGRAGVVIVLDEPDDPRSEEPDFVILEEVQGRWLVDEIHEDGGSTGAQVISTPAA
jgi:hypothetical protein